MTRSHWTPQLDALLGQVPDGVVAAKAGLTTSMVGIRRRSLGIPDFRNRRRGPSDDLRLQFEAVAAFDPEDRKVAKAVLDGLILEHQAKRLAQGG